MRGVFSDGRAFFMKTRNKRGRSSNRGHLKMRDGKTNSGRLIPAERVARMGTWLANDRASSYTIEDEQTFNAPTRQKSNVVDKEVNIPGNYNLSYKLLVNLISLFVILSILMCNFILY